MNNPSWPEGDFTYTRDWTNPSDAEHGGFLTVESDEDTVRADMQCLYDEVKEFINGTLKDEVTSKAASADLADATGAAHIGAINPVRSEDDTVQGVIDDLQGEIVAAQVEITHKPDADDVIGRLDDGFGDIPFITEAGTLSSSGIPWQNVARDDAQTKVGGHLAAYDEDGYLTDSRKSADDFDAAGAANTVQSHLDDHTGDTNIHVNAAQKAEWSGKQDALTFDDAPTTGSSNPVRSGGVKTALDGKLPLLDDDIAVGGHVRLIGEHDNNTVARSTVFADEILMKATWPLPASGSLIQFDSDGKAVKSGVLASSVATKGYADNAAATVQDNLDAHTGDRSNPHGVTKAQVGLENVDNTSDANKPVSTATQAALDGKADKVGGATDGNLAALDANGNLTDSGVSSADLVLSTPQTLTEAQQTQARHNIKAAKWATATATNKPAAGGTLPARVISVDDAEGGEPISLTFAADNASGVDNNGKYELYGYLRIYHQLAKAADSWTATSSAGADVSAEDGVITVETKQVFSGAKTQGMTTISSAQDGHYFLLVYDVRADPAYSASIGKNVGAVLGQNAGISFSQRTLSADWATYSQIKQAGTIGNNNQLLVTAAESGTHFQLRNVMLFDLTQMFPVNRPTSVSAFWSLMSAAGYGTGYQQPTANTSLVQSTFDFSTDPIAAGETADVTAETSLQTGYNQIVQTDGSTTDNTVTLTYLRDLGIVLDNLAAAIAALPSSGN